MTPLGFVALVAALCPQLVPAAQGRGQDAVVHTPAPRAQTLNNEGKALYRQGRFEEARARYRAALEADPAFLGPALNAACALARQERFADAAREAADLVARAFVPWGREVMEAADLAVLHVRPEMSALRTAMAGAAPAWGSAVSEGLLFVGRTRPAVRLEGQGVLVLGLHQEIFAWSPATGRYLQVTSDDGRVLAFVRSADGRRVFYLRGGKLVRGEGPSPALRGLSIRSLDLATMSLGAPADVPGDVLRAGLRAAGPVAEVLLTTTAGRRRLRFDGITLVDGPVAPGNGAAVVLGSTGITGTVAAGPRGCPFRAEDLRTREGLPGVRIRTRGQAFWLAAPYGAGLAGLPFSDAVAGATAASPPSRRAGE